MVREYKSLYITNEMEKAREAKAAGRYVVLALPLADGGDGRLTAEPSGAQTEDRTEDRPAAENMKAGDKLAVTSAEFPYALEHMEEVSQDYLDRLILRFENKPWLIFETERCRVREITAMDVDALYEIYADPKITMYMEDLYESREKELAYTRDYIKNHYGFYEFGMWIIEDRKTHQIIGRAGLDMVAERQAPQLGFMIRTDRQGKGYATEVCRAILCYAKETLGIRQVEAACDRRNISSARLLEKLGFEREEETGEMLRYSIRLS